MRKITLLTLILIPLFGFSQTFDFTSSSDGWDAVTTGATLTPNATFVAVDLTEGVNNPKFGSTTAGVDGVTNTICAVTLQNLSANGPTFLRISYPKAAGGRVYQQQDITAGDSGYVTYYFDLTNSEWGDTATEDDIQVHFKAAGNATYTVPVGGVTVNIDKIEFISSIPTTLRETYTFDTDNDTEGFVATNGSISGPAGGILTFTPDPGKYAKIEQTLHHINADTHKYVHITLKNNSATNDQLRFIYGTNTRTMTMSTSDASDQTYTFDLSDAGTDPEWTGNQTFTIGIGSTISANPGQANDSGTVEFNSIVADNTLANREFNTATFSMYPNPARNVLNFQTKDEISTIKIYDITGKVVMTSSTLSDKRMNVSQLTTGIYLVHLQTRDNKNGIRKLVKQ
ncbi:T9SS type A sorting domain-containing protein [Gaetbulibacter aestuarii]|uniref:T9SS type A sorting domain-containing protein n=1 Tax=Gaetbulibacter aestuarii TaxID=1502358 RepID=A0ABW7MWV9_9FLAO